MSWASEKQNASYTAAVIHIDEMKVKNTNYMLKYRGSLTISAVYFCKSLKTRENLGERIWSNTAFPMLQNQKEWNRGIAALLISFWCADFF